MNSSSSSVRRRPWRFLPQTEAVEIGNGLMLSPRFKLLLTFFRSDPAVKPIDEWQLKLSLSEFLRSSLSLSVPDEDLLLRKHPDLHKRKRDDPVAFGTLYIRDLGFLTKQRDEDDLVDDEATQEKFLKWRSSVVERLGGLVLNLEGVKFRMTVEIPQSDDFEQMKRSWEDIYASELLDNRNSLRGAAHRPDTIVIQGVPSRWLAEPRVSSKASMLVTHTIFSVLGNIRNLNVAGDDDLGKIARETTREIVSGLQCKVWVQFENHDEFCNAMTVLCGRSMQKQGSRLKVDYEVSWDRDGFFRNVQQRPARTHVLERGGQMQRWPNKAPRYVSQVVHSESDGPRPKRFRD